MSIAYKAFDSNLKCREFQFEIGKTYSVEGIIRACRNGFHSCKNPLDVLDYYPLIDSRFCEVEISGDTDAEGNKTCSRTIKIIKELTRQELIEQSVQYMISNFSKAASSGFNSKAASSGNGSKAASSGYSSTAASSGNSSTAASSGNFSKAASSGNSSTAASSGYRSTAASSGYNSKAASSGDYSKAASSGHCSTAASSGFNSTAASSGNGSIAAGIGKCCKVLGDIGNLLVLIHYVDDMPNKAVSCIVGENGIKPNTYYQLNELGVFEEVK